MPCTIIDNPQILREAVEEGSAHPTHENSESIITSLAPAIDEYAKRYGEIADKAWTEEYGEMVYKGHLPLVNELYEGKNTENKENRNILNDLLNNLNLT